MDWLGNPWSSSRLRKGSNSALLRMMLESGAGLASHGRGETLLHAMPERLIRTGAGEHRDSGSGSLKGSVLKFL